MQPLPPVPLHQEKINAAAMLPRGFEAEEDEVVYLKRRLREEKARVARAEKARREAEEKCRDAERERAMYRMLARRWHNRLNAVIEEQQNPQGENHPAMAVDMVDDALGDIVLNGDGVRSLAGLRMLLDQHLDDEVQSVEENEDEVQETSEDEDMDHHDVDNEMEDDELVDADAPGVNDMLEFSVDDHPSESVPVPVAASLSSNESVADSVEMEDVERSKRRAYQPRTVSISSDDL
eukprot:scaffold12861_cov56-Cyclotella_meneghiniana.AAC.1